VSPASGWRVERAWPIDSATDRLGTSRVPVLADEPVFIEVR
jgi:hypothetical protein